MEPAMQVATVKATKPPLGEGFWSNLLERRASIASLSSLDPMQRIDLLKHGFPAAFLEIVSAELAIDKSQLYRTIGIARATADRKLRQERVLSQDESERLLGIASLIGQVERVVRESGEPEGFNAATWTARWLEQPQPALGGRRPAEFMDSAEGRSIVSNLIARAQSGAYA